MTSSGRNTMTSELIHSLERTIVICATRATVFRFFTDSQRFADWWGEGSKIDGRAGGNVYIRYPNGVVASGQVLEIHAPERIVFTYGYESGKPFPPGASRVTVLLKEQAGGTLLTLQHEFADPDTRNEHVQGWRYQLALFANVASAAQHSDLHQQLDAYFALWNTTDGAARMKKMEELFVSDVRFQDKHSSTGGLEDMNDHLSAYQRFMPGMTLTRDGDAKECQGMAIVRWLATKEDGSRVAAGTNVFTLSPEGRIRSVTGFWD